MIKQNYKIKLVEEFSFSEIDFDLYYSLFGDDWSNDETFEYPDCKGKFQGNLGYPIQIDRLIEKLQKFKDKGANYVGIEYHCDHIGYDLEALKIESI